MSYNYRKRLAPRFIYKANAKANIQQGSHKHKAHTHTKSKHKQATRFTAEGTAQQAQHTHTKRHKRQEPGGKHPLVGLRWWRRERRRQAEGQRTEVGEESVDGVPVLRAAKRPPELQVTTHFKDGVSRTPKGHLLNDKLIANRPQGPG